MHILLLANGSSSFVELWSQIADSNHKVTIVSVRDKHDGISTDRINYIKISSIFGILGSYIKLILKIRKIIVKYKPDLLISHYVLTYGIIASVSSFKPHISVVYGSDVFQAPKIAKKFLQRVFNKSDKIIVQSSSTGDFLIEKFTGVENKILQQNPRLDSRIFNLSIRETKEPRTKVLDEFNIQKNSKYIFSGRCLRRVYNQEIILDAFEKINEKYPDYKLIMISCSEQDRGNLPYLKKIIKRKNLDKSIIWITRELLEKEMADIYSFSEVMINIPKSDQLAYTLLESIACGCFPIVSDLKPYYEVITNYKNGIIIEANTLNILESFQMFKNNSTKFQREAILNSKNILKNYFNTQFFVLSLQEKFKKLINYYEQKSLK